MQLDTALLIILIIGLFGVIYFLNKKLNELKNPTQDNATLEWLKSTQSSIDSMNKTLNDAMRSSSMEMTKVLQENSKQLNDRLTKAAEVIQGVSKGVGEMSEIGRNMKELQEFLKSPKLRGNIGEEVLKDLIAQMFPKNSFNLQYQFKSGERVDAAIKTDAGILPIDSKFPMENFQKMAKSEDKETRAIFEREFVKDVKKHIDAISKKYILPDEGTMDFALMYVPSESVYYELVNLTDLMDYARKSRIYIVSPSTLYAHLQTILLSFEGKKIEAHSREVFRTLRALQIDYDKVQDNMGVLGKHINNASAQFSNVTSQFLNMGQKLNSTRNLEEKIVNEIADTEVKGGDTL